MANIWSLTINVVNAQDAEKMKDPKRYDYCGNLLSVEEKAGALLLKIETERGQNALAYALKAKFPELEVEIEEVLYEDDTFE